MRNNDLIPHMITKNLQCLPLMVFKNPLGDSDLDTDAGLGDYCWPTAYGLLGRRHPGPRLSHMAG